MVFQGEMGGPDVSGFGHHRGGSSDGTTGCPKWGSAVFRLDPAVLLVRGEVMSAARVCTAVLMGRAWFIPAPWPRAAAWVCTAVLMGRAVSSQPHGRQLLPCLVLEVTLSAQPSREGAHN